MSSETGFYYYRARYYDPERGRFLQVDPIGYARGMNRYQYCKNNPINLIDPFGLCSKRSNKHFYAAGTWNKNTKFSAQLGQVVWITAKNVNILGTTISIDSNFDQIQQSILLPQQEHVFNFSVISSEPVPWEFDVTTNSDAFIILYKIESTWVPGMPPNR